MCALDPLLTLLYPSTPRLQETSQREEWRRRGEASIHQPRSEGSVWARCDGRRAGTELPEPPFIFPPMSLFPPRLLLSAPTTEDYLVPASLRSQVEQSSKTARGENSKGDFSFFFSWLLLNHSLCRVPLKNGEQKKPKAADVKCFVDLFLSASGVRMSHGLYFVSENPKNASKLQKQNKKKNPLFSNSSVQKKPRLCRPSLKSKR